jgi:hypothetical protein
MTIEIRLEVVEKVEDLICGIGIARSDGSVVAGTNTFISGVPLKCPDAGETLTISYAVDSLPLLGENYKVTTAVHSRASKHTYDHHENAYEFSVVDESGRVGICELGGKWTVQVPEKARG